MAACAMGLDNPNVKEERHGRTPLHFFLTWFTGNYQRGKVPYRLRSEVILDLLLQHGVKMNRTDKDDYNTLDGLNMFPHLQKCLARYSGIIMKKRKRHSNNNVDKSANYQKVMHKQIGEFRL